MSDKSISEPNLLAIDDHISPNFVSARGKRKRLSKTMSDDMSEIRNEMKDLFYATAQKQEAQMNKLFPILKDIQTANGKIEQAISFLTEQNTEFKNKIRTLETELKKRDEQIILLEDRLEDTMRSRLCRAIDIKNVPIDQKETNEDLLNLIFPKLIDTLDLKISKNDIADIYKTKSKTERKTVVVEFTSTLIKQEILKKTKAFNIRNKSNKLSAKHLGLNKNPDVPIFISETLTHRANRLYFLARDLKKSKNYKYCWTSFGRVYVKKDDDSTVVWIRNEQQVQNLMNLKL
jgi:hypothetical protein